MQFKEAFRNSTQLGIEWARTITNNRELATKALSVCAFVAPIPTDITVSASLLPLEPWQITAAKIAIVTFTGGMYLNNLASTLNANQGRDRGHRILGNLGLIASGIATAAIDVIAVTAPF